MTNTLVNLPYQRLGLFAVAVVSVFLLAGCITETNSPSPMPGVTAIADSPAPVLGILLNQFMLIVYVEPGSAAALAGIRAGDTLDSINSQKVTAPDQAKQLFDTTNASQPNKVTILRRGKAIEFQIPFAHPSDSRGQATVTPVPNGTVFF